MLTLYWLCARVCLSVCLSVCHKSAFYQNGQRDRARFWLRCYALFILQFGRELGYLQNKGISLRNVVLNFVKFGNYTRRPSRVLLT